MMVVRKLRGCRRQYAGELRLGGGAEQEVERRRAVDVEEDELADLRGQARIELRTRPRAC